MREENHDGMARGVSSNKIIALHIEGSHLPSIDLLDMPGLVAAPIDLKNKTRELVLAQLEARWHSSIFLLTVPASERPNSSLASELVLERNLESRTVGVFTMCDELPARHLSAFTRHVSVSPKSRDTAQSREFSRLLWDT